MRSPVTLYVAIGVWLAACRESSSWAQPASEPWPRVVASGTCPDAGAVRSLLATLVPPARAAATPIAPAAGVTDLGAEYVVALGERSKTYADSARDCAQRARVAAAFIALALLPEEGPSPSGAAPTPSNVRAPERPTLPPPARGLAAWMSLDARGALAIGLPTTLVAPGILIRAAGGRETLGAHASCGWFFGASATFAGEAGSVLVERLACDAGMTGRLFWLGGRFETALDAGIAVGLLRATGRGFSSSYAASRTELGGRIAVDTALHLDGGSPGLLPIVGLEVTAYATSYDFDVTPQGIVGRAPVVWSAVTAGVRWSANVRP